MDKSKVLIISSYPPAGTLYGKGVSGAAHYLKTLLQDIKDEDFLVLSQIDKENPKANKAYTERNISVEPSWDKGSIFYFVGIIKSLFKHREHKKAIINFEFKIFGGDTQLVSILNLLTFPFVVATLKLLRMKYLVIMHPAMLGSKELVALSDHLKKKKYDPMLQIFAFGNRMFMWFLILFCKYTVTFEGEFGRRLQSLPFIRNEKIHVVPHHIYPKSGKSIDEKERKQFELLFFGFLSPYKGVHNLIDIVNSKYWPKDIHLTVAGGNSPSADTGEYYENAMREMKKNKNIEHTGFVPDGEITKYFERADLVILPYSVMMASSGPMSMAISYNKPFILSETLQLYTETKDFKDALEKLGLHKSDFIVKISEKELIHKLNELKNDQNKLLKLEELSRTLAESRSLEKNAFRYGKLIKRL